MRRLAQLIGTGIFLVAGCATAPPTGELAAASSAVGAAHEAGAETATGAHGELVVARQELAQAESLMHAGENRAAYDLLIRAKADADLATARAREEHLRREADQVSRRAEALRNETQF